MQEVVDPSGNFVVVEAFLLHFETGGPHIIYAFLHKDLGPAFLALVAVEERSADVVMPVTKNIGGDIHPFTRYPFDKIIAVVYFRLYIFDNNSVSHVRFFA